MPASEASVREELSESKRPGPVLTAARRYAVAVALVSAAGLLQWATAPASSPTPFMLLGVAMTFATAYGGRGPGLLATVMAAGVGNYFFLAPVGQLKLEGPGFVATLGFVALGALVAAVGNRLKVANARAAGVTAALRRSEARFRTALDNMPEPVSIHDLDGRIEYANPPLALMLRRKREEIVGRRLEEIRGEYDVGQFVETMRRAVDSGRRQSFTWRSRHAQPSLHAKVDFVPIADEGGHVAQVLAVAWDLTERVLAESELRRSETIIEQAGELAHLGAWSVDFRDLEELGANALRWSPELYRIFGYEPGALPVGLRMLTECILPEDRAPSLAAFQRSLAERSPFQADFRIVRPDGAERVVSAHGRWQLDANGQPERIVGAAQDITDRRRVEEALREADRHKDEFLGVLSHELRNPLAPIRNSAFTLSKNPSLDERARRAVAIIDRQSGHLARLVDDLLDVTRIARSKVQLRCEPLDLAHLVRRVVDDHRGLLESHRLEVRLPSEPVRVHGDPTRLSQVVGNLLGNAAKFTPDGGKVEVSLSARDGRAVLEVRDEGIGIEPETLGRLFVPFSQADRSLDRSKGGLGLGLALVKGLVELHGGRAAAGSEGLGRGACFTVELPLDERASAAAASQPAGTAAAAATGRRVLVVEDNRDAADSLRETLESWGHRVSVAHGGAEGLALAREVCPDVVLCDVGLPGELDGYAVARALRHGQAAPGTLLVAVSGYAQPEDLRRAREAGFDRHFAKPPDLAELERLLAR